MDDNVLSTLIHTWAEILGNIVSVAAFSAAAWWFLATTKFKPRIQFDLECNFLEIDKSSDSLIAELQLIFENKGFVEHRLYDVNISITISDRAYYDEYSSMTPVKYNKTLKAIKAAGLGTMIDEFVIGKVKNVINGDKLLKGEYEIDVADDEALPLVWLIIN